MSTTSQSAKSIDLIWGAESIAEALGRTRRSTFHLLEKGEIPAKKVGGRWVASRDALRKHFEGVANADA